MRIWKYPLAWGNTIAVQMPEAITIAMPVGAVILKVDVDPERMYDAFPVIYARVDPKAALEKRTFRLCEVDADGIPSPKEATYLGSVRCKGRKRSVHVFGV